MIKKRIITLVLLLISLTGCNPFKAFAPSSSMLQDNGWAWVEEKPQQDMIVCYNTIGRPQCQTYESPKPLDEERRIG